MKKPISLRAHLTQHVPQLQKHPDKLHVFIERGAVATKPGVSASWEYRYALQLIITDYSDSSDTLVLPIIAWLHVNQPDLIADYERNGKAISFEAEIIDHTTVDLSHTIELSERVIVRQTATGWTCEHVDEPPLPDLTGPTGWALYVKGILLGSGDA